MRFHQLKNRLLGLAGLAVVPVLVAGCGGVPGNAVATVDGTNITKSDYKHWASIVLKSSGQQDAVLPDPPDYTKCIAAKRAKLPKPGKGQPKTTDAQLKTQCKSEGEQVRNTALQVLLQEQWLKGEAKRLDVTPSKKELDKSYDTLVKQSFPNKGDLEKQEKQTGQTPADIRLFADLEAYKQAIVKKVTADSSKVSDKEISDYYNKNKARFGQPERRDLRVVLTKTEDKAKAAKAAIDGGQSFAAVAKKYSIDQASKSQGGKLTGVAKGQQEQALDKAIFSAKKGQLTGPVKTQFGWYVFEVTKSTPASQQTLDQAKATIKQTLQSQASTKAIESFSTKFQKRWRDKTECAAGYKTPDCGNGPKPTPTPTPATGAPSGQATPAPTS
jgi:foldase protein PrsA